MGKILNEIENSIKNNKDCRKVQSVMSSKVKYVEKGYMRSRDKEILALLSDSYYGKRFYAHIFKDCNTKKWVSLIVWMPDYLHNLKGKYFFKAYAKATANVEFAQCVTQNKNDVYKENNSLINAVTSLINMIDSFEVDNRMSDNENVFHSKDPRSHFDMRIYKVYC